MSIKQVKIGRPSDIKGKSPVVCLRIQQSTINKIDQIAAQQSCSRSSVIIHAINKIIQEQDK
jgi:predicted transcriptional regulator